MAVWVAEKELCSNPQSTVGAMGLYFRFEAVDNKKTLRTVGACCL
jgi:hypothetical protein